MLLLAASSGCAAMGLQTTLKSASAASITVTVTDGPLKLLDRSILHTHTLAQTQKMFLFFFIDETISYHFLVKSTLVGLFVIRFALPERITSSFPVTCQSKKISERRRDKINSSIRKKGERSIKLLSSCCTTVNERSLKY